MGGQSARLHRRQAAGKEAQHGVNGRVSKEMADYCKLFPEAMHVTCWEKVFLRLCGVLYFSGLQTAGKLSLRLQADITHHEESITGCTSDEIKKAQEFVFELSQKESETGYEAVTALRAADLCNVTKWLKTF